jgi:hypothetical protein
MNPSPEILTELETISPFLARLPRINVFEVPEGYFNELELRISGFVAVNTVPEESMGKRNLQQVPAGYFDTLSSSILARVKAVYPESSREELLRISPMLLSLKGNIFSVPDNYFQSFAGSVIEKLQQATDVDESAGQELSNISTLLLNLKGNVFSVPEGYFNSFAGGVMEKLGTEIAGADNAADELKSISPVLSRLRDVNVFSVPVGYFDALAEKVLAKVSPKQAKVVSMKRSLSWLKYAAAAVITGAIAVSSLQIFKINEGQSVVAGLPEYIKASFQYKTEDQLNAGIARLSDDDIVKFLEKNSNVMDEESLTNNTDVSELPSQQDYLNDENTLNTYLDKIDAESADKSTP